MSHRVHTPATIRHRLPLSWVAAAIAAAIGAALLVAAPASAHDELVGSDPADGSVTTEAVTQVTLSFSAEISTEEGATEIQVTDAAGTSVLDGAPVVDGATVTQPITPTVDGTYTVLWKVVSSDGHPISGELSFDAAGAPTPTPTETATPSDAPSDSASPTVSPAPVEGDADAWLPWVIGGGIALLVLVAAVYLMASRTRRKGSAEAIPPGQEPPADR